MSKRLYFELGSPYPRSLREDEIFLIRLPAPVQIGGIALAEKIAEKVDVRWIRVNARYDLLATDRVDGRFFSERTGIVLLRYNLHIRGDAEIAIRIEKKKPLDLEDCVRFTSSDDGDSTVRFGIGWIGLDQLGAR